MIGLEILGSATAAIHTYGRYKYLKGRSDRYEEMKPIVDILAKQCRRKREEV